MATKRLKFGVKHWSVHKFTSYDKVKVTKNVLGTIFLLVSNFLLIFIYDRSSVFAGFVISAFDISPWNPIVWCSSHLIALS